MHWKCFGCGKFGDAISWVRERKGVSFLEAVSLLQGKIEDRFEWKPRKHSTSIIPVRRTPAPSVDFSQKAEIVVSECVEILASPACAKARHWLLARGLTEETITRWCLGFNPTEGRRHGLFLRRGITIPWFNGDTLLAIKIRRADDDPKYEWVGGGQRSGLYLGDTLKAGIPTLLVEGEFDALVGWQEFRDIVNVATLGSAADRPDQKSLEQIISSPVVLVCYDRDQPGREGAAVWQELSARMRVISVPKGKDLNEFHLLHGDLRGWVTEQLHLTGYKATRHPTLRPIALLNNEIGVILAPDTYPTLCRSKGGLSQAGPSGILDSSEQEAVDERAAIMEFDGELGHEEAERKASNILLIRQERD